MENCKENVEITMRAAVLDVTPDEEGAETEAAAPAAEAEPVEMAATEAAPEPASAPDPELVAAGEKVFRKCKACHQVGEGAKNRVGPQLNGVMGRAAGAVDGFKYSSALEGMAGDGLVWDDENLAAFLADPRGFMKGTRMAFAGLRSDEDIAAITAYLSTFGE
jgi:cytochrome c